MENECFVVIVNIINNLIGLILMIILIVFGFRDSKKFEYVWICSEIKTIKNMVKVNSFNSQIFNSISPKGTVDSLSATYYDLLKLYTESRCKDGYKICGKLDTLGNKLCIDETYSCPINSIKVDLISKKNDYINAGYTFVNLEGLSYNYLLYFSNNINEGNSLISMIKTYYKPKYINYYNFILDSDAFQETFGPFKLSQRSNINSNNNQTNNENKQSPNNDRRRLDNDNYDDAAVNLVSNVISSIEKGIESLISYSNAKTLIKFMDYIEKKIEVNENNDKYYMDIGDNYYVKNYIGFQSNDDLDKFLKFDFSLHKRLFPNKISSIFAIICLVAYLILLFMNFFLFCNSSDCFIRLLITISFFTNLVILLGFLIYSSIIFNDVYKSKDLLQLNEIKSDDFIMGFIKEYLSIFDKRGLIIATIVIITILLFSQILCMFCLFNFIKDD